MTSEMRMVPEHCQTPRTETTVLSDQDDNLWLQICMYLPPIPPEAQPNEFGLFCATEYVSLNMLLDTVPEAALIDAIQRKVSAKVAELNRQSTVQ